MPRKARCPNKDNFAVEKIIACRGAVTARSYLIRWEGYGAEADSWEPRSNIPPQMINEFEIATGNYVFNWKFRCDVCDLPCASAKLTRLASSRDCHGSCQQGFHDFTEPQEVRSDMDGYSKPIIS